MKFYKKLSKRGMFCDKNVEHIFLKSFINNGLLDRVEERKTIYLDLDYFDTPLQASVGFYQDNIVRIILRIPATTNLDGEIGRLLVEESEFINTVSYLTNKKI